MKDLIFYIGVMYLAWLLLRATVSILTVCLNFQNVRDEIDGLRRRIIKLEDGK